MAAGEKLVDAWCCQFNQLALASSKIQKSTQTGRRGRKASSPFHREQNLLEQEWVKLCFALNGNLCRTCVAWASAMERRHFLHCCLSPTDTISIFSPLQVMRTSWWGFKTSWQLLAAQVSFGLKRIISPGVCIQICYSDNTRKQFCLLSHFCFSLFIASL